MRRAALALLILAAWITLVFGLALTGCGDTDGTKADAGGTSPAARSFLSTATDPASLIDQAKAELLLTTKSGQWYSAHLGTAGHWTNAWSLLEQAKGLPVPPPPPPPAPPPPPPPAPGLGTALPARMPESVGPTVSVVAGGSVATAVANASSGTTIQLHGGTYGVTNILHRRFSPTNPVTITSYPGEQAVFRGQTAYTNAVYFDDTQGIRVRNVTFAARTNVNLKIVNSHHFEVDRVISRDSGRDLYGQGLLVNGYPDVNDVFQRSEDVQVWNSVFTNNGGTSTGSSGSESHDHAIYMGGGSAAGATATTGGVYGYVIANCLLFDSPAGYTVQLGGAARSGIVANNTFYNLTTSAAVSGSQIVVWSPSYGGYGTQNNRITNNIFAKQNGHAVDASLGWNPPGNLVTNNLAWQFESPAYYPIYGVYTGFTVGTNLTPADPLFVTPTGTFGSLTGRDFHLRSGSPALGKSDPAYTPPFDLAGDARPVTPALGAYG